MSDHNPPVIAPEDDKLLTFAQLAARWGYCHPKVVVRRVKALGSPLVRLNARTVLVRLSDVLKAEEEASA
jgi:hypothetical protein